MSNLSYARPMPDGTWKPVATPRPGDIATWDPSRPTAHFGRVVLIEPRRYRAARLIRTIWKKVTRR